MNPCRTATAAVGRFLAHRLQRHVRSEGRRELPTFSHSDVPSGREAYLDRLSKLPKQPQTARRGDQRFRLLATGDELPALALQPLLNPHGNFLQAFPRTQRALPDDPNAPAGLDQRRPVIPVAADVGRELPLPVRLIGRRRCCARTALVAMPETAVHEADRSVAREDEVRPAGEERNRGACSEGPGRAARGGGSTPARCSGSGLSP